MKVNNINSKNNQIESVIMQNNKVRIVKRIGTDGNAQFIIQQKHFLFKWWWVDAWINSWAGASCKDYFDTLAEAKKNLRYFNYPKSKDIVFA